MHLWMPDLFPLKTLVPTALTGEFEGGGTELDNYEIETKAVAHISLCAAQMPIAKDMEYNGFAQLGITEADGTALVALSVQIQRHGTTSPLAFLTVCRQSRL